MLAHHVLTSCAFANRETDQLSVPLQMAHQAAWETSLMNLSQKRMRLRVEAVAYHVHQHPVHAHVHLHVHHLPHLGSAQHCGHFLPHHLASNRNPWYHNGSTVRHPLDDQKLMTTSTMSVISLSRLATTSNRVSVP